MSANVLRRCAAVAGVALLLALPFVGKWARRDTEARCDLDGAALVTNYRVRVEDAAGKSHDFCCIRCAELWLERQTGPARAVRVRDERSGAEIEADAAHYVRSLVITTPTTGNRIHAFRDSADAQRHAETCRGTILLAGERPFVARRE